MFWGPLVSNDHTPAKGSAAVLVIVPSGDDDDLARMVGLSKLEKQEQMVELSALPFVRVLRDVANVYQSAAALGNALNAVPEPVSPQMARSAQASINRWHRVFEEHHFLSSVEASDLLGARSSNRSLASDHRSKGKLLGVKRGNSFAYPEFQFDPATGAVRPVITKLISLARANDWSDKSLLLWLVTPTGSFDDTRPIDHWNDPEQILAGFRSRLEPTW